MLTGQVLPAPTQPRSLQAPTAPGPPHLPSDPTHPPQPRPHSSKGPRSPPQLRLSRRPPRTSPLLTQVPSRSAGPHCQETRFGTLPLFGSPAAPALTQATPQPLGPTPSPGPGPHTPAGRSLTPTVTLSPQAMLTASGHDPSRPLPPTRQTYTPNSLHGNVKDVPATWGPKVVCSPPEPNPLHGPPAQGTQLLHLIFILFWKAQPQRA